MPIHLADGSVWSSSEAAPGAAPARSELVIVVEKEIQQGPAGASGAPGDPGPAGYSAFTIVTGNFVQPSVDDEVIVHVGQTNWIADGMYVYVEGGGFYVATVLTNTQMSLLNIGHIDNAAQGTTIVATAKVAPAGPPGETGADGYSIPEANITSAVIIEDPAGVRVVRRLTQDDILPGFAVASFTAYGASGGLLERGQSLTLGAPPHAAAAYTSGPPSSATLVSAFAGSSNGSDTGPGTWVFSSPYASGTNFTAIVRFGTDGAADPSMGVTLSAIKGTVTQNVTRTWTWTGRRRYGLGSAGGGETVDAAFVLALTSAVATSRAGSFTVSPSNQYVYFVVPSQYGTPTFTLNSFPFAASLVSNDLAVTNAYGVTRAEDVYRSDNLLTGSNLTIVVT